MGIRLMGRSRYPLRESESARPACQSRFRYGLVSGWDFLSQIKPLDRQEPRIDRYRRATAMTDALDRVIEDLHAEGRLRVWSIIISIFGDLIQPRTASLPAPALRQLTGRMAIGSGAVRTALSRLVKDGWIMRRRNGRSFDYRLTPASDPAFGSAARLIYARADTADVGEVCLVILAEHSSADDQHALVSGGLIPLRRHVFLCPGVNPPGIAGSEQWLIFRGGTDRLPGWASTAINPPEYSAAFEHILTRFSPLATSTERLGLLDATVARVLLIHFWRRAVLRQPIVPAGLRPSGWPGARCRGFVADLHDRLADISARWVTETLPGVEPGRRFTRTNGEREK